MTGWAAFWLLAAVAVWSAYKADREIAHLKHEERMAEIRRRTEDL